MTTSHMITRTETDGIITYALLLDGKQISHLDIDSKTRMVWNVETATGHERRGYARSLWEAANAESECFHALEHHRTAEGDAYAEAMGGATIDEQAGFVAECCICTGE